jgi:VTC domain
MKPSTQPAGAHLALFRSIGLDALNSKAAMLERLDNKYVVHRSVLEAACNEFARSFDILEIDGQRAFTYETCYFDDANHGCYHDHHQGRRRRLKVRVRRYVDAGLCFVEVKLKDKRGITVKKRLKVDWDEYRTLGARALEHVERSHRDLYGEPFGRELAPVLEMSYRRITLVAREGGERMTIDQGISFLRADGQSTTDPDLFVVETKSANGNGQADAILRGLHQHPTDGCSKYCVGMAATGAVSRFNRFRPALRKLGQLDLAAQRAARQAATAAQGPT